MIDAYKEESPLATEVRRVISKLKVAQQESNIKCVMVTSSSLGEGKSTFAACLAVACSMYRDTKTVIVDFDLRRPRVHDLFRLRKRHGVADMLTGKKVVKQCLKGTKYPNLMVISSGRDSQRNTSALLNSPRLPEVFNELKFYFDLVIVDAPPVIPVSDPLMLSSEIDGALFVIRAGKTQKPVIERAVQLLRDARITPLGAVINNMSHALPYYYEYDFYDYKYYNEPEEPSSKTIIVGKEP